MDIDYDKVLHEYGIRSAEKITPITTGLINETFHVQTEREAYILQKLNRDVFPRVQDIMSNIEAIHTLLESRDDYHVPSIIKTMNGDSHVSLSDASWRLMGYVEKNRVYESTADAQVAGEAGRIIGVFHSVSKACDVEDLKITIADFHNLQLRLSQLSEAKKAAPADRLREAHLCLDSIQELAAYFDQIESLKLPLRVTHNDTKLNNILFDRESGRALCMVDLDTVMPGYFFHDFGDAVRTLCNSMGEESVDFDSIRFNDRLFESFTENYLHEISDLLTPDEWTSLGIGVEFMPFIMAVRFLADFLNGNQYYRIAYDHHNLDRCKNQIMLIKQIIERREWIKDLILSYKA